MQCPFIVRRSDAEDGAVPPETPRADGGSQEGEHNRSCSLTRIGSLEPTVFRWNLHRRW